MTMFATSGKCEATEPASRLCCIISCILSILAACLLFMFLSFLSKEKAPSSGGSLEQLIRV
jgi:hypothetical protein